MFYSTLAALVSVIPVLCSLILRSLRGWVLWEPLDSSLQIKLLQQGPTLVLHFPNNLSPSLGSCRPEVQLYFNPPGQFFSKCWCELEPLAAPPRGNLRAGFSYTDCSSGGALRTRYVQLLSGFVGTAGGLAGLVLPLSRCLVTGIPSLIGSS